MCCIQRLPKPYVCFAKKRTTFNFNNKMHKINNEMHKTFNISIEYECE